MVRILFSGGGSGGHTYPIVSVARALKDIAQAENISLDLVFAGAVNFEKNLLTKEGVRVYSIPAGKLRRYPSILVPLDILKAILGFFYAFFFLWWLLPDVIFSKGGYGSLAIGLVGRVYFIPLVVHESDHNPGLANKLLAKIANKVIISFPDTAKFFNTKRTVFLGNPVRIELKNATQKDARALFSIKGDRPIILILGGSQGSTRINKLIAESLRDLLLHYEVIHQCGQSNEAVFKNELLTLYNIDVKVSPYYHLKGSFNEKEQAAALAAADFIVSRAGAGTIYEIALVGKPALLIPLPEAASRHQHYNAFYYARLGAAIVIEQENLTPHILMNEIANIVNNPEKIEKMSKAAKEFAKPDAAEKIARGLLELTK